MRLVFLTATLFVSSGVRAGEWEQLPSLPDREGFAGSFAGVSMGALLVAGGSNFPDRKPWEGGKKTWYDSVFVLEHPNGPWKIAGKLPRPLAYGVSVTYGGGVVCVGGCDRDRHYAETFRLDWKAGQLVRTNLPPLSKTLANACGALVGDILYVAGGQVKPNSRDALKSVWTIDLAAPEPKWKAIASCPGRGRILAVAAGQEGAFWLAGGADLVVAPGEKIERRYLRDAYRYHPRNGWKRIADLPYPVVAAPSPAPTDARGFYVLGGDDGSQLGADPDKHKGFRKTMLRCDSNTEKWVMAGVLSASRVTVSCVRWSKTWVMPGGEVQPGVRSPEVWSWKPGTKE